MYLEWANDQGQQYDQENCQEHLKVFHHLRRHQGFVLFFGNLLRWSLIFVRQELVPEIYFVFLPHYCSTQYSLVSTEVLIISYTFTDKNSVRIYWMFDEWENHTQNTNNMSVCLSVTVSLCSLHNGVLTGVTMSLRSSKIIVCILYVLSLRHILEIIKMLVHCGHLYFDEIVFIVMFSFLERWNQQNILIFALLFLLWSGSGYKYKDEYTDSGKKQFMFFGFIFRPSFVWVIFQLYYL